MILVATLDLKMVIYIFPWKPGRQHSSKIWKNLWRLGKCWTWGETGLAGVEDWWYPSYMKDRCPGLPNWEALKGCAEVFATADTAPKGRYIGGPVSWGDHDERMVAALDLPFEVIHPGTDAAMFAEMKSAYEREAPIVMWVWQPHWLTSVYDGEYVQFPKFEVDCFDDAAWGTKLSRHL